MTKRKKKLINSMLIKTLNSNAFQDGVYSDGHHEKCFIIGR